MAVRKFWPKCLPMIVMVNLAKGALVMSRTRSSPSGEFPLTGKVCAERGRKRPLCSLLCRVICGRAARK
jgi:hypothetical protein